MRINISSTPAILGSTEGAPLSIANAELIATTKHIALDNSDNNIQAITVALGDIFTQARFSSLIVTIGKKAATQNLTKRWDDRKVGAKFSEGNASEGFAFATDNIKVIQGGEVLL